MREGARDKGKEGRGRKVKGSEQAVTEHLTCALCYAKKRFHFCIMQGGIDICLSSQNFPRNSFECVATYTYLCIFPNSVWMSGQGD